MLGAYKVQYFQGVLEGFVLFLDSKFSGSAPSNPKLTRSSHLAIYFAGIAIIFPSKILQSPTRRTRGVLGEMEAAGLPFTEDSPETISPEARNPEA